MSFEIDTGMSVGILDEATARSVHKSLTRARALLVAAALFVVVGAIAPWQIDAFINAKVSDLVVIDSPQSSGYDRWISANRTKQAYFLYDYGNFGSVLNNNGTAAAKPRVAEIGPFVYTVHQGRYNVSFLAGGEKVRYREQQYFVYDAAASIDHAGRNLASNHPITNVNIPLLALFVLGQQNANTGLLNSLIFTDGVGGGVKSPTELVNSCTTAEFGKVPCGGLFHRRAAEELLFGYECPLLQAAQGWLALLSLGAFSTWYPGLVANVTTRSECAWDGKPCADDLGYNTLYTGKGDLSRIKSYAEFHNLTDPIEVLHSGATYTSTGELKKAAAYVRPWGNSSRCAEGSAELQAECAAAARVGGNTGTQFTPNQSKNQSLEVWVPNIFRHVFIVNAGGTTIQHEGITPLKYTIPPSAFAPSELNAAAYDMIATPPGTLNLTKLQRGLDVSMSKPHFLDADRALYEAIDGWSKPDPEKHDTFIAVEPITGASMLAHQRLQLNLRLHPLVVNANTSAEYTWFGNVSDATLPLLWVDQFGNISPDEAAKFRSQIYDTKAAAQWLQYTLLPLGVLLLMFGTKYYRRFAMERAAALLELEGDGRHNNYDVSFVAGPRMPSFAPQQNPLA